MASYEKRGRRWRARVHVDGKRDSATFATKGEAVAWADRREAELVGTALPDKTLKEAFRRYASEESPKRRGERWEVVRLAMLERDPLARVRLAGVKPTDIADWRDRRLQAVSGASVAREMNLLRSVFDVALREWGWLRVNPCVGVKRPPQPASRKRRVSQDEIDRLTLAFGLGDGLKAETATHRTGLAFLFAVETAMRSGEITGLRWSDVGAKSVTLPLTKNGDSRQVPLTLRARAILAALPREGEFAFGVDAGVRDTLFRKIRDRAEVVGLHFHDSRSEAIWRLSRKMDVLELARVIGHRDTRSLMLYYEIDADALADQLG